MPQLVCHDWDVEVLGRDRVACTRGGVARVRHAVQRWLGEKEEDVAVVGRSVLRMWRDVGGVGV